MNKIAWTAVLLGVALVAVGCAKQETQPPPGPAADQQPGGGAQQPGDSGPTEQPGEGTGKGESNVAGAIGRALLKGFAGGSGPDREEPGKAPPPP